MVFWSDGGVGSTVCQLDKLEVDGSPDEAFNIKPFFFTRSWARVFGRHYSVLLVAKLCMEVSGRLCGVCKEDGLDLLFCFCFFVVVTGSLAL